LLADEQNLVEFGASLAQKYAFPEGGTKLEWVRKKLVPFGCLLRFVHVLSFSLP